MKQKENYQYEKIKLYLIENIKKEKYKNNKIESENELAKKFNVSRMTVRQAVMSLQSEGYVYTVPKKGSFVVKKEKFKELDGLQSFTEDVSKLGKKTKTKVVYLKKIKTPENSKITSVEVWRFIRIRYLDTIALAYEEGLLNSDVIPMINQENLEKSLYEYLEKTLNLDIEYAEQDILAVMDSKISRKLDFDNQPLLKVSQVTYLKNEICLEECDTFYRCDNYSFHQNAYRRKIQ